MVPWTALCFKPGEDQKDFLTTDFTDNTRLRWELWRGEQVALRLPLGALRFAPNIRVIRG